VGHTRPTPFNFDRWVAPEQELPDAQVRFDKRELSLSKVMALVVTLLHFGILHAFSLTLSRLSKLIMADFAPGLCIFFCAAEAC